MSKVVDYVRWRLFVKWVGKVPLRLTTIEEASPGSKVFLFEDDCKGTMGTGTVVVHIIPAVETLLSDSNPFRRMSCTNERSECFSGTLRSRLDNRARLRIAASLPLTGLKYWKEQKIKLSNIWIFAPKIAKITLLDSSSTLQNDLRLKSFQSCFMSTRLFNFSFFGTKYSYCFIAYLLMKSVQCLTFPQTSFLLTLGLLRNRCCFL